MTSTTIRTTARAKFFTGARIETLPVVVEPDDSILVWDEVAGHYTRVHSLSRRTERRIAREARA